MNIFRAADILEFALRIEEDGELFYREAAQRASDSAVQDLFNRLAGEEIRHKVLFQEMLSKIGEYSPAETYPGEYLAYLRDYIDGKVVFTRELRETSMRTATDAFSAIEFAMQRELGSIVYYQEIKQFVPEKDRGILGDIIAEERKHFSKLAEAKRNYSSSL
jgi:rubrerythrin